MLEIPSPIVQSLASFVARAGLLWLVPSALEGSAAIDSGNLTKGNTGTYWLLFHQRTLTKEYGRRNPFIFVTGKTCKR